MSFNYFRPYSNDTESRNSSLLHRAATFPKSSAATQSTHKKHSAESHRWECNWHECSSHRSGSAAPAAFDKGLRFGENIERPMRAGFSLRVSGHRDRWKT